MEKNDGNVWQEAVNTIRYVDTTITNLTIFRNQLKKRFKITEMDLEMR